MKLVYIAGKYRDKSVWGIAQNIHLAESYAVKYWRLGYAVICPHKNTAFLDGSVQTDDFNVWMEGDLEMLSRCDVIVMIPGWEKSEGARIEHAFAEKHGLQIIYEN